MKRTCGDCTACCTVMGVPSIGKPHNARCEKLGSIGGFPGDTRKGCSVYAERPQECRDFSCVWLQDDGKIFRNMERPDRVEVVFDVTGETSKLGAQALVARATRRGALKTPAAQALIGRLAKRVPIILVDGDGRSLIGPEDLVRKVRKISEVLS